MARILIAGCGDVGSQLGSILADHGHKVWGLRRHPEALLQQIQPLAGDLADPKSLTQLPLNIDTLYYTAAASEYSDAGYQSAYVDGVKNILTSLDCSNLSRVVFVSSTGVYAQSDGSKVDEDSPAEPQNFSGVRLLEGEAMARTSAVTYWNTASTWAIRSARPNCPMSLISMPFALNTEAMRSPCLFSMPRGL